MRVKLPSLTSGSKRVPCRGEGWIKSLIRSLLNVNLPPNLSSLNFQLKHYHLSSNPLQRYEKHLTYTSMQGTKISLKSLTYLPKKNTPLNKPLPWIRVLFFSSFASCVAMPFSGFRPPRVHLSRQKVNETWAGSQRFQYGKVCKRRSLL